jgi:hypothetical protein
MSEREAFLEQQFAAAVGLLRHNEANQAACIKRIGDQHEHSIAVMQKAYDDSIAQHKAFAARYAVLREHMVRVRDLGILANNEHLDHLLDKEITRVTQAQKTSVAINSQPKIQ